MATLSITKSWSDTVLLSASDLDNIVDAVETILNTTKLNDDNIVANGLTASSKIKSSSITAAKINTDAVTNIKIQDDAVETVKILDDAVTTAKLAAGTVEKEKYSTTFGNSIIGSITLFHTFGGALSVPRGWMKCNGDLINETTYDAQHGSGSYDTDLVVSSALLTKPTPANQTRYALGIADTSDPGNSSIATVGNSGSTIDRSHTHTVDSHTHANQANVTHHIGIVGIGYTIKQSIHPNTSVENTRTSASAGGSTLDIRPESIEFIYIIKVI